MDLSNLNLSSLPSWLVAVIVIITAVASHYYKPLLEYFKGKNELQAIKDKERDAQDIAANQQALLIYQDIVKGLRDDLSKLEGYYKQKIIKLENAIERLEKERLACREENAAHKQEIKFLTEEVAELKKKIQ